MRFRSGSSVEVGDVGELLSISLGVVAAGTHEPEMNVMRVSKAYLPVPVCFQYYFWIFTASV